MSFDVLGALSERLVRPRIVHSLPGRVRLFLPILKRIGAEIDVPVDLITVFAERISGIRRIEVNPLTGSALVVYDETIFDGDRIVAAFVTLGRTAIAYRERISAIDPERHESVLRSIGDHIATRKLDELLSQSALELPDAIWT